MVYRNKFLQHIIFIMDAASTASHIAKKVAVMDAILWVTSAWDRVKQETATKSWFSEALLDAQPTKTSGTTKICVTVMSQPRKPSVMTGKDTCC